VSESERVGVGGGVCGGGGGGGGEGGRRYFFFLTSMRVGILTCEHLQQCRQYRNTSRASSPHMVP